MSVRAVVESLEARCLLSADLTVAFASPLPPALSLTNNTLVLKIQNVGDTIAAGSVTVSLFASADQTLDEGDTLLGSKMFPAHILAGHFGVDAVKFPSPAALPTGSYYIIADAEPDASIGDDDAANNVVPSSTLVQIQQPFVDLTAQIKLSGPTSIKAGKPAPTIITLFNQGNIIASGSAVIALGLSTSPDGSSPISLATLTPHLHIAPHGHANVPATKIIPLGTSADTYYSTAVIQSTTFTQSDTSNDSAVSPTARTIVNPFANLVGTLNGTATSTAHLVTSVALTVSSESNIDGTFSGAGSITPAGNSAIALTLTGAVSTSGAVTIQVVADIGSLTLKGRVVGSKLIGTYLASDGSRGSVSLTITPGPPGPLLASPLDSDVSTVLVGNPEIDHFNATVTNADANTTVEVDEVDSSGNLIGKLTDLFDDGNAANGDAAANDGIYSGVNTISFDAPGNRYFRVNVLESGSSVAVSPTITIPGIAAPSQQQLQQDITDSANLNQIAQSNITSGGSDANALAAVDAALQSDGNVVQSSIQMSDHSIEWTDSDGLPDAIDLDADTGTGSRAAPPMVNLTAAPLDDTTGKPALVISPYDWDFGDQDEAFPILSLLQGDGYNPTTYIDSTSTDTNVTIDSFKNMGQYDTVAIVSHGDLLPDGTVGVLTNVQRTIGNTLTYLSDVFNGRLQVVNGTYAITRKFVRTYDGSFNDSIIYVGSCFSAYNDTLANAFLGANADSYIGYTNLVTSPFAYQQGVATFTTLVKSTGNTVADIPGIDVAADSEPPNARFVEFGNKAATLPQPGLLQNFDVYIQYSWPQIEDDLDSNTGFLGTSAGYAQDNDSPYLDWSGDDTGAGGSETTTVNIYQAWVDQQWTNTTTITAAADWYSNAEIPGSGPALLTIALENKTTGKLIDETTHTMNPGQEVDGATTLQATITVNLTGDPTNPVVGLAISYP